jgi:hypothetical protein
MNPVNLTDREVATILAALRYWQQDLAANDEVRICQEHFDDKNTPLTVEEIDELCERINCGPSPE